VRRLSPMVLLVLAVVFGGLAAYLAAGWLKAKSHQAHQTARQTVATTPVVVAAGEIGAGSTLEPEMLKVVQWPREAQVAGAIFEAEQVRGRVTRYPLAPGEVILESKLAPQGAPAGLAGIIRDDRRAVTVKVDEASGVAGFIMPGNRVDVLVTIGRNEFRDDPVTQVVLQNLAVLGTGQDIEQQRGGEKAKVVPTVTMEVTPEEAERLTLAAKEGHITLALRGWTEQEAPATHGVRVSGLLRPGKAEATFAAPIEPVKAPAPRPGIEIIRGLDRGMVNF